MVGHTDQITMPPAISSTRFLEPCVLLISRHRLEQPARKARDCRRVEDSGHRQVPTQFRLDLNDELQDQQRVSAELEEVVVPRNPIYLQDPLPDPRQGRTRSPPEALRTPAACRHRLPVAATPCDPTYR